MDNQAIDLTSAFKRMTEEGKGEETTSLGGVDVRLVHVSAGGDGRWDRHDDSTETVLVWTGSFTVDFKDHTLELGAGQCCVVPVNADHRGTSKTGAEVVLFRTSP